MEWHPMFCSVYISLILLTAGFVLTICSWLAPAVSAFVANVRVMGIALLSFGCLTLSISCFVSVINHGKCCFFCYAKKEEDPYCIPHVIANTLLSTTAIVASNVVKDEGDMDGSKCNSISGDRNAHDRNKRKLK